jgi:hypothetical protein
MKITFTEKERESLIEALQNSGEIDMAKWWSIFGSGTVVPPVVSWVPWTDAISTATFETNTGLTVLSAINPQDSSSVTLGVPDVAQVITSKGGLFNGDMAFDIFDNDARLVNLGTTNGIKANSSIGLISALGADFGSGPFSSPIIVSYCFDITRLPVSNETLFSFGNATVTGSFITVDITSSGFIQYNYKNASAQTITNTSSTAIPLDTKLCLTALFERSKVRIILHGGSFNISTQITAEGAFNTSLGNLLFAVNAKYMDNTVTQPRTSGSFYGSIIASGITTKSFDVVTNSCLFFKVPNTSTDISTLDNGLISLIQGPGAGGLATPRADVVDLIAGTVFTATGTQAATVAGKFHNALPLTMTPSTVYLKGTVPASWDIYSGSYGNYTVFARHKTGTIDASTRNIFCLNTTGAPSTQNVRLQQSTTNKFELVVDNAIKATSTITCTSNTFYDIVFKGSGGTHTFSVNGETPIAFTPGTRSAVGGYFGLGGHFTAANTILHPGRGHLDVLALWNRALTADEIVQLRKGGDGLDGMFNYLTQYDDIIDPPTVVNENRGTQLLCTNNNNIFLTSGATSGPTATYLSFVPPRSGRIRKVSLWWKGNNAGGYSAGNGGTYTLSIRTDNGSGAPSATVVAEQSGITGWTLSGTAAQMNAANIRTTTLTVQNALVTKGVQYHMLITNTNGSPAANYISLNTSDLYAKNRSLSTPTIGNTNIFTIFAGTNKGGTSIAPNQRTQWQGAPNVVFHLDKDDNGTTDFWWGFPSSSCFSANTNEKSTPFGGSTRIRQVLPIEFGDNFTIKKIWFAGNRQGSPGDLTARILASNQVTVLGTTTISQTQFSSITPGTGTIPEWGSGAFSSPIVITGGSTYYLELYSATGGTSNQWWPSTIQDLHTWMIINASGTDLGFSGISGVLGGWYGTTGLLQISTNSGSSYSTYSNGHDLGWYFEVTVP